MKVREAEPKRAQRGNSKIYQNVHRTESKIIELIN